MARSIQFPCRFSCFNLSFTPILETVARRRLLRVSKGQVGSTLQVLFETIPQSAYKENTIFVSCMYWKDANGVNHYFITSVDVIYLIEGLIGGGLAGEAKCRIRRNNESSVPWALSKTQIELRTSSGPSCNISILVLTSSKRHQGLQMEYSVSDVEEGFLQICESA